MNITGNDLFALALGPHFTAPGQEPVASEDALEADIVLLDQDAADSEGQRMATQAAAATR